MAPRSTLVKVGSLTDTGLKRAVNEDSLLWSDPAGDRAALQSRGRLYVVADGLGGYAAGEVASRICVDTVVRDYEQSDGRNIPDALRRAIVDANAQIFQAAQSNNAQSGMGSTVVSAVIRGKDLYLAHVGDSRAYLLRDGVLHQLTTDHTLTNDLVKQGLLSEAEIPTHPQRHVLSRAVGKRPTVEPELHERLDLMNGDLLLLCTDGVHGYVDEERLTFALVSNANNPQTVAEVLIQLANDAGGEDNMTALVVKLEQVVVSPAVPSDSPNPSTPGALPDAVSPIPTAPSTPVARQAPAAKTLLLAQTEKRAVQAPFLARAKGFRMAPVLLLLFGMLLGAIASGTIGFPLWQELRAQRFDPGAVAVLPFTTTSSPVPSSIALRLPSTTPVTALPASPGATPSEIPTPTMGAAALSTLVPTQTETPTPVAVSATPTDVPTTPTTAAPSTLTMTIASSNALQFGSGTAQELIPLQFPDEGVLTFTVMLTTTTMHIDGTPPLKSTLEITDTFRQVELEFVTPAGLRAQQAMAVSFVSLQDNPRRLLELSKGTLRFPDVRVDARFPTLVLRVGPSPLNRVSTLNIEVDWSSAPAASAPTIKLNLK